VAGFSTHEDRALDGDRCDVGFNTRLLKRVLCAEAASAATEGKRRSAGQRERIDAAIDTPGLLSVADPE
jgi:hypothetical protein